MAVQPARSAVPEKSLRQGDFHLPVLTGQVNEYLRVDSYRRIVDATIGDGGHALALLETASSRLQLIGIDTDPHSLEIAKQRLSRFADRVKLVSGNFRELRQLLGSLNIALVDGILADLGVSSRQIDLPERGFSFMHEGPLDLRLNPHLTGTAAGLLADLEPDELVRILRDYGEEKLARPIANAIVKRRQQQAIRTTTDLRAIVEGVVRGPHRIKSLARVFQALRIAVNDELGALHEFLDQAVTVLRPEGRLAVISYHSLEDRIVKQFFAQQSKGCVCPPEFPMCACGKQSTAVLLTRRVIKAPPAEIHNNPRSRSARLRVLQRR